jgi:hypothetical protein
MHDLCTHFLVRTCVDRLASNGSHTIAAEMEETGVKVTSKFAMMRVRTLEIKFKRITTVLPPIGNRSVIRHST